MAANQSEGNFLRERTDPPKRYKKIIKEPRKLLFELIYLFFMFVPLLILSIIESYQAKPKSVAGKVVLVTGAGRGLGRGLALKFADLGCSVACVDIDEELNKETIKLIDEKYLSTKTKSYKCNVGNMDDIKALKKAVIEDFGEVNILINNAGLINTSPLLEIDEQTAQAFFSVNLVSHVLMMTEFMPEMVKRNEGHVVSVSSSSAFIGLSKASLYSSTKHGLLGLMESVDFELQERPNNKVRTSTICPYFVNTSPFYMQFWDVRLPPLRIEETVNAAVDGILKNKKIVTIPSHLFYILLIQRMLPDRLNHLLRKIFYVNLISPSKEFKENLPLYQKYVEVMK